MMIFFPKHNFDYRSEIVYVSATANVKHNTSTKNYIPSIISTTGIMSSSRSRSRKWEWCTRCFEFAFAPLVCIPFLTLCSDSFHKLLPLSFLLLRFNLSFVRKLFFFSRFLFLILCSVVSFYWCAFILIFNQLLAVACLLFKFLLSLFFLAVKFHIMEKINLIRGHTCFQNLVQFWSIRSKN